MDLWQLRTFRVVAKNLHFTRAAEDLNLSQPAVSHQIKALEKEIGEQLFLRERDGVSLTDAGETMYEHVIKILDIADELSLEIQENRELMQGRLVVGASTQGLNNPFPALYNGFKEKYADIELVFQAERSPQLIAEKVRQGEIDIGVLGKIDEMHQLDILPYADFEFILVARKDHPLAGEEKITAQQLQKQQWVMFNESSRLRTWAIEALDNAGVKPEKIQEINEGSILLLMLLNSESISILPTWGAVELLREGKLVKLDFELPEQNFKLFCVWKKDVRSKALDALLTYILEEKFESAGAVKKKTDES